MAICQCSFLFRAWKLPYKLYSLQTLPVKRNRVRSAQSGPFPVERAASSFLFLFLITRKMRGSNLSRMKRKLDDRDLMRMAEEGVPAALQECCEAEAKLWWEAVRERYGASPEQREGFIREITRMRLQKITLREREDLKSLLFVKLKLEEDRVRLDPPVCK